jgi:hypothetical protein
MMVLSRGIGLFSVDLDAGWSMSFFEEMCGVKGVDKIRATGEK